MSLPSFIAESRHRLHRMFVRYRRNCWRRPQRSHSRAQWRRRHNCPPGLELHLPPGAAPVKAQPLPAGAKEWRFWNLSLRMRNECWTCSRRCQIFPWLLPLRLARNGFLLARQMTNAAPPAANPTNFLGRFFGKFSVLGDGMRELWIVFAIKLLGVAAYGVTNFTLVLWFESDLGFSDPSALRLVAAWSLLMTLGTVLSGSLADAIGLRRTF